MEDRTKVGAERGNPSLVNEGSAMQQQPGAIAGNNSMRQSSASESDLETVIKVGNNGGTKCANVQPHQQ